MIGLTFMIVLGGLLAGFGPILIISAIPMTSWDASWAEIKEAFHIMFSKPRFQIGLACLVLGLIILLSIGMLFMS